MKLLEALVKISEIEGEDHAISLYMHVPAHPVDTTEKIKELEKKWLEKQDNCVQNDVVEKIRKLERLMEEI